jgi:glutaredoxin
VNGRVTLPQVEPVSVRASSSRAAANETPRGKRPVLWIALATAAILGVVITAINTRGRRPDARSEVIGAEVIRSEQSAVHGSVGHAVEPSSLAAASHLVSIEMYSAAWCAACSRAKEWMRGQGITYHEVDVDRRAGALAQLQMLNPRSSLPTFDVDGQIIVGFEETRLRNAIDDAARRVARAED